MLCSHRLTFRTQRLQGFQIAYDLCFRGLGFRVEGRGRTRCFALGCSGFSLMFWGWARPYRNWVQHFRAVPLDELAGHAMAWQVRPAA